MITKLMGLAIARPKEAKAIIEATLDAVDGQHTAAAKRLKVSRPTYYRIRELLKMGDAP